MLCCEREIKDYLIRNSLWTFGLKFTNMLLVFGTSFLLAKFIGAKDYGIYAYVISWTQILAIFSVLGLNTLLVREVSRYLAVNDLNRLKGLIRWAKQVWILSSITFSMGFALILMKYLVRHVDSDVKNTLWVGILLIPALSLSLLLQGGLQGAGKIIEAQIPQFFVLPIMFLLLLICVYITFKLDSIIVVILRIIAVGASLIIAFHLFKKYLYNPKLSSITPVYERKLWIKSAFSLLFVNASGILSQKLPVVLVGWLVGAKAAGIFDIALKVSILVNFTQLILSWPFSPVIATLYAQSKIKDLQRLITKVWALGSFGSILVGVIYFIFGKHILSAFGFEFSSGSDVLLILTLSQIFNVLMGPALLLLNMSGFETETAKNVAISFLTNLLLGYVFTQKIGIMGTALSTLVSVIILSLFMWRTAITKLKINTCPLIFWV